MYAAKQNPESRARIPEFGTAPVRTAAGTFEEVQSYLRALKGMPLERAAVGILAFAGLIVASTFAEQQNLTPG